ncbi:MAG: hypothetical protein ACTHY5_05105 [Oceanisphaera sp.]|uniref:hypothetical protein n=1 Tax=Oceanisphaera sp. TaxID=1929979 RepID=UPI003F949A27
MMIYKAKLGEVDKTFFCFFNNKIFRGDKFYLLKDHTGFSGELYLSLDKKRLLKIEKNKYSLKLNFPRWFFRDFFKKLFILGLDSKREYKGYKIARSAGLKTPDFYCWGINPWLLSDISSILMIEYKENVTPGFTYLKSLSECDQKIFITKLANQAVSLARFGFVHRDFHLNNFLIDSDDDIYWIDTHFKKLSFFDNSKSKQLINSLDNEKLGGVKNKEIFLDVFKENNLY